MERIYDEVIAGMLIQLDNMQTSFEKNDKRMDLSIKQMVRAETRLELIEKSDLSNY